MTTDWRWLLASFQDAVKVERGCGELVLGFSLALLVSPQANFFRASGSEETEVDCFFAKRKRVEANGHDAEAGEASGTWKTPPPHPENGWIRGSVMRPDSQPWLIHPAQDRLSAKPRRVRRAPSAARRRRRGAQWRQGRGRWARGRAPCSSRCRRRRSACPAGG
ncbi:MAG: hypothetical protein CJBNEKGG_00012 [Prosthecobacter sp.]|nr:hypothetical protein [Prosthecobacter sp.]